ncbi:hypothetical protein IQ07DRAFT_296829 [Pyrenochaeta sp. DS3sAY3a]|nr:hypothetical protein IQ07DRAFT_296829 [Pyrenochaeta sp. DS3sAY3a]
MMKFNILLYIFTLLGFALVFAAPIDSPSHALVSLNITAPASTNLSLADLLYTNLAHVTLSSRYENWVTKSIIEKFTFEITMEKFLYYRQRGMPRSLNWKSEGCTGVPDKPMKYDFQNSCYRHDFAYRNFKNLGIWDKKLKKRIDKNFKNDMLSQCDKEKVLRRVFCVFWAKIYYRGVRVFS